MSVSVHDSFTRCSSSARTRLRGDTLFLDQIVPGATLDIGAQKLVGHIPVPEKERRIRVEPLFEL